VLHGGDGKVHFVKEEQHVKLRAIFVSVATVGLMVGPAFAHGIMNSVAGAAKDCTITGTAADDDLTGTTKDDVICTKAGSDDATGLEGNDVIRGGQGDDELCGGDGSDVVKGQADDDDVEGAGQNDKLYGGNGDDYMGYEATGLSGCDTNEPGNDFLKSHDNVSGNDRVDGGANTDTCRIDAGDTVDNNDGLGCEL
jgi:Ca2+-binding RTX toxin-like protein